MTDKEQLAILDQWVEAWDAWRAGAIGNFVCGRA
jgi:hypothetical protein